MGLNFRDPRVLDKDLRRLAAIEAAGFTVLRPIMRVGLALAVVGVAMVIGAATIGAGAPTIMVLGIGMSVWLALSIGANDVANALAPAYGARALPMMAGLLLVGLAGVAGALVAGERVADTIAGGVIARDNLLIGLEPARVMTAALIGAAGWISLAVWLRAPVSTTHSLIGALAGAGCAAFGAAGIMWSNLASLALVWVIAPLVSGVLAAALLWLIRARVHRAPDRVSAARRWLPALVGVMLAVFTTYVAQVALDAQLWLVGLWAVVIGALAWLTTRQALDRQIRTQTDERLTIKRLFGMPLAMTAPVLGFAHGANDAANVAAPLSVILQSGGFWGVGVSLPIWVMALAGALILLGMTLFGRRLVHMVGGGITRLNPVRAFCVSLAAATTVLLCSGFGLPVSTTHVAVGAVFGVGFFREWDDMRRRKIRAKLPPEEMRRRVLMRRSHVLTILAAWVITLPGAGLVAALAYWLIAV